MSISLGGEVQGGTAGQDSDKIYTYSNGKNQRDGFTYDPSGNLTNDQVQTYTYYANGQQFSAEFPGYGLQQFYDGDGLRAQKYENGATTSYVRSSVLGGAVVAEVDASGNWSRGYVYAGGELMSVQQGGQLYWVHEDSVTKSKRITDVYGNVVSTVELDPYGANTNRSNNSAFLPQSFTTYVRDGNGDQDAMARRYDTSSSRFSQPDPYGGSYDFGDPQSLNRYAYTKNDPVNFRDPSGLELCLPFIGCIGMPVITTSTLEPKLQNPRGSSSVSGFFGSGTEGITMIEDMPGGEEPGGGGPQNPTPQITPCDRKFASIFGDSNAVGRTAYDYNGRYRGLDPTARANAAGLPRSDFSNPVWDAEHLYNFPHLSGNLAGTENADIYVPGNYTGRPTGPTKGDAIATFYYKNFFGMKNVTLAVFHVGNFSTERMPDGSVRIGTTGGPGGNTPGSSTPNLHSHFELWRGRGYRPPGAGRDAARIPLTPVICK